MSDADENAAALAHMAALGIKVHTSQAPSPVAPSGEPREHELKAYPKSWESVRDYRNTAQVRQDDRQYRVGDVLLLREFNPEFGFTGDTCKRRISHILRHEDMPMAIRRGWCVLSLAKIDGELGVSLEQASKLADFYSLHAGEMRTAFIEYLSRNHPPLSAELLRLFEA